MALAEFVKNAASAIYLLNHRYTPYYKWMLRGLKDLPRLSYLSVPLEELIAGRRETDGNIMGQKDRSAAIEGVCQEIIKEIKSQGLSCGSWDYLEPHAIEIMEHIQNGQIRNLHLMDE